MKKASLIIFVASLLLSILALITYDVPLDQKSFVNFQQSYKSYSINPTDFDVLSSNVYYPFVNVPPTDPRYFLGGIREQINLEYNNYEPIQYTSKIISELRKWGNNIPIDSPAGSFNNCWNSLLTHYSELIKKQISLINKKKYTSIKESKWRELKDYLRNHQQELKFIIFSLDRDDNTKESLETSINNMFSILYGLLPYNFTSEPKKLGYELLLVNDEKEYGIYKASIDTSDIPDSIFKDSIFKINDKEIDPENFAIDNTDLSLTMELPNNQNLKHEDWTEEINKNNIYTHYYFDIPSIEYKKGQRYFINLNYQFDAPITLSIRQSYLLTARDKRGNKKKIVKGDDYLINQTLLPENQNTTFHQTIYFSEDSKDKKYGNVRVMIGSKLELKDKILSTDIQLIPVYTPTITLEKIDNFPDIKPEISYEKINNNVYNVKFSNTTVVQENYIFSLFGFGWQITPTGEYSATVKFMPGIIAFRLFLISLLIVILNIYYLLSKIFNKGKQNWIDGLLSIKLWVDIFGFISKIISAPFLFLSKQLYRICRKYKSSLFVIILLFILLDVIFFQSTSNIIRFFIIIIWIYTTATFPVEAKVTLLSAVSLLTLCALSLFTYNEFIAEKAAVWTYLLLSVGIGQLTYQLISPSENLLDIYSFQTAIIKESALIRYSAIFYRYFKLIIMPKLKSSLIKIFGFIYFFITKKVLNPHPKTRADVFLNCVRLTIFLIVSSAIFYASYIATVSVNNSIQVEKRRRTRLAQNPQIKEVQPYLVYHSTKAMIKGSNMGWNETESNRLMSQYGEVTTETWTDQKVIFTIPLHWKPGIVKLWIEKPAIWENEEMITNSDPVTIKVLPINSTFTPDDDAFFEQLKKLDKEVLDLNGYTF